MGIKKSAFASRSERENFYKLSRTWGDKFRLYHNLPFLNIFTFEDLPDITSLEINRLKKTSVDYCVCNEYDEFILSIDFDGWLQGINEGTQYQPLYPPTDAWRKEITDLKLRVAHGSSFPYFIFSSEEFKDISSDVPMTLVDGIIGDVIANKTANDRYHAFQNRAGFEFSETEATLLVSARSMRSVSEPGKELPVDWSLLFQVAAETDHNPIMNRAWELWDELGRPLHTYSIGSASAVITTKDWADDNPMKKRFPNGIPAGCTMTVHSQDCGDVSASVNLHDFQTPGYSPFRLSEHISLLLALDKLKRLRRKRM